MNEEKYVLARIKADLVCKAQKAEKYSIEKDVYTRMLLTIAKYEAENILGDVIEVEVK